MLQSEIFQYNLSPIDIIFVIAWFIIAILFLILAISSESIRKKLDVIIRKLENGKIDVSLSTSGDIVIINPELKEIIALLSKYSSFISKGTVIGAIISFIAALIALIQLLFYA